MAVFVIWALLTERIAINLKAFRYLSIPTLFIESPFFLVAKCLLRPCTVESLLKDTPNKGHHRKYLSMKDTLGGTKNRLLYSSNTFSSLKSGQPLHSGQISWYQCVLYTEVFLYTLYDLACKDLGLDNHIRVQPRSNDSVAFPLSKCFRHLCICHQIYQNGVSLNNWKFCFE